MWSRKPTHSLMGKLLYLQGSKHIPLQVHEFCVLKKITKVIFDEKKMDSVLYSKSEGSICVSLDFIKNKITKGHMLFNANVSFRKHFKGCVRREVIRKLMTDDNCRDPLDIKNAPKI